MLDLNCFYSPWICICLDLLRFSPFWWLIIIFVVMLSVLHLTSLCKLIFKLFSITPGCIYCFVFSVCSESVMSIFFLLCILFMFYDLWRIGIVLFFLFRVYYVMYCIFFCTYWGNMLWYYTVLMICLWI